MRLEVIPEGSALSSGSPQLETEQKKVAVAAQDKIEQLKKLGK
ncbi:MAG TPA: hypothetical protein VF360_03920 [Candidatus Methanoperedens sp.]